MGDSLDPAAEAVIANFRAAHEHQFASIREISDIDGLVAFLTLSHWTHAKGQHRERQSERLVGELPSQIVRECVEAGCQRDDLGGTRRPTVGAGMFDGLGHLATAEPHRSTSENAGQRSPLAAVAVARDE